MKYCEVCGQQYEVLIDINCCDSCEAIKNMGIELRCISNTIFLDMMPVGSVVSMFDDYADKPIFFPVFREVESPGKAFYKVGDVLLWLTNNWLSVIDPVSGDLAGAAGAESDTLAVPLEAGESLPGSTGS